MVDLQNAVEKIKKRFGSNRSNEVQRLIENGDLKKAIMMLLEYYDKGYRHGLSQRPSSQVSHVHVVGRNHDRVAKKLLRYRG